MACIQASILRVRVHDETACTFVCVYGRNHDLCGAQANRPVRKPEKKPHLEEAGFRSVESIAWERRSTLCAARARAALFSTPPRAACTLALLGAQTAQSRSVSRAPTPPGRKRWEPRAVRETSGCISRNRRPALLQGPGGARRKRGGESATRAGVRAASLPPSCVWRRGPGGPWLDELRARLPEGPRLRRSRRGLLRGKC